MNELASMINSLFLPDRAPTIGVSGGVIQFFNPAAKSLLPDIAQGQTARDILPAVFLQDKEEVFVSTARLGNRSVSACAAWFSGLLLLRMNVSQPKYLLSPEGLTASLRLELGAQRAALDVMAMQPEVMEQPVARDCYAALNRSYYKILRTCNNVSLADKLARGEITYHPKAVYLPGLLRELTALVSQTAVHSGIEIRFVCKEDIDPILADGELLRSLILNLFSNSLRHSAVGGSIKLQLRSLGSQLELCVDDSGTGISRETMGTLFRHGLDNEPAGWHQGNGLGLFIVWGITEMHGGSVTVVNRARGGVSVRILLPRSNASSKLSSPTEGYGSSANAVRTALADALPPEAFLS